MDLSPELAKRVFDWSSQNMRSSAGSFYYQHRGWFINRISYMRWSQAWMLVGMVGVLQRLENSESPGAGRPEQQSNKGTKSRMGIAG